MNTNTVEYLAGMLAPIAQSAWESMLWQVRLEGVLFVFLAALFATAIVLGLRWVYRRYDTAEGVDRAMIVCISAPVCLFMLMFLAVFSAEAMKCLLSPEGRAVIQLVGGGK